MFLDILLRVDGREKMKHNCDIRNVQAVKKMLLNIVITT